MRGKIRHGKEDRESGGEKKKPIRYYKISLEDTRRYYNLTYFQRIIFDHWIASGYLCESRGKRTVRRLLQ